MQIKAEVEACDPGLHQENDKQRIKNAFLRKKRDKIGEGAGNIIGVNTHKFAAQSTAEGIYHRHLTVHGVSESFIEVNILTVEVKHEYRTVSEGVDLHGKINDIIQYHGNYECIYQI